MDHVAIMNKSWKLIPKILSGEKTIESRWYKAKTLPWGRVQEGDRVYFRDAGGPVTAVAKIAKVEQYENYNGKTLQDIIDKYHGNGYINFVSSKRDVFDWAKERKYCVLMFLENPRPVEPFYVNKAGYGVASAWMAVEDINKIKISR